MSEVAVLYAAIAALSSIIVSGLGAFWALHLRDRAAHDQAVLMLAASTAVHAQALALCNAERTADLQKANAGKPPTSGV